MPAKGHDSRKMPDAKGRNAHGRRPTGTCTKASTRRSPKRLRPPDGRQRSPEALRAWLVDHSLLHDGEILSDADLQRALEAREALRALLEANNGATVAAAPVTALNRIADGARLRVQFERDGRAQLAPVASGVDSALGRLLAIVYTALAEGTWVRLKICRKPRAATARTASGCRRTRPNCSSSGMANRSPPPRTPRSRWWTGAPIRRSR